ncbi:hypothetical protein UNSWDHB_262 [Dehalobacter sp. UNSWDHB]|nr:hypothetical protein UNSWDHB_262 [Dehalobacter sp. UNSWDHB]
MHLPFLPTKLRPSPIREWVSANQHSLQQILKGNYIGAAVIR